MNTCKWFLEDDESNVFSTDCGNIHCIDEGSPYENGMKFCCYCGAELEQILDVVY